MYKQWRPHHAVMNRDARPTSIDAPLMLSFKIVQGAFHFLFFL